MPSTRKEAYKAFSNKNWKLAINYFTFIINKNSSDHKLYNDRAECYFNLKKYESALNDCKISIKLKNNYYLSWNILGKILYQQNKLDKAQKCFIKSLQLESNNKIAKLYHKKLEEEYINLEDIDYSEITLANTNIFLDLIKSFMENKDIASTLNDPILKQKLEKFNENPLEILNDPDFIKILKLFI